MPIPFRPPWAALGVLLAIPGATTAAAIDIDVSVTAYSSGYCFNPVDLSNCAGGCECSAVSDGASTSITSSPACRNCVISVVREGPLGLRISAAGEREQLADCTCTSITEGVRWTIQFSDPVYAQVTGSIADFNGLNWWLAATPRTQFASHNVWGVFGAMACDVSFQFTKCRADFDADGTIGGGDLAFLLNHWGPSIFNVRLDLDGSGAVDGGDIGQLLLQWGTCEP